MIIKNIKTQGSVLYAEDDETITETIQNDGSKLRTSTGWSATWEPTGGNRTIDNAAVVTEEDTYIPINAEDTELSTISSEDYLVMPQLLESVTYSIKVAFYNDDDEVVAEKKLEGTLSTEICEEWVAGNAYTYTIQLPTAEKPIDFGTPGFINWNVVQPIELNIEDYPNPTQG